MRALRLAAAAAAAVLLAGCAQPAAEQTDAPSAGPTHSSGSTPTSSPTATASPTSVEPLEGWQRIETPNGSASFLIPPGWEAQIDGEAVGYDGSEWWSNRISVMDASGEARLEYWDGPGDDVGAVESFAVLAEERLETLDAAELQGVGDPDAEWLEHWARAWWSAGGVEVSAHVAVSPHRSEGAAPASTFGDGRRMISFGTRASFATQAEAVAWLEGDEAAEAFEIVRTLDLHGAPADAMPEQ